MAKKFDTKELCLRFLYAESEQAVQKILESVPEMASSRNWRPLDRRETNFNITSNQASDGGKALTELMTNMVDAVLLKCARMKNVDPLGKHVPKTMYDAVDKFVKNLRGGKLVNLEPNDPWLRDFAQKNLLIGITGAKSARAGLPCYTFVDNGEGQSPGDFENTFLSLSSGNKKDIPFVQGKYNMGSSGVLGYCGLRWFKLIISRRYDGKSPWGFTLMRRRPGGGMPVAEYFILPDGEMPSFEDDVIYPFVKGDGKRYDGAHLETGTIVKLYDYQIGSRFSSGFRGAREALNENLVETILPFRLLDFRQKPDPTRSGDRAEGIDPRPFYGMEFLLIRSHKENIEDAEEDDAAGTGDKIAVATIRDPHLGRIEVGAIPLKRSIPGWLDKSNNRVFHAVNGQVQFKQTRGYLSQTCGFPALKDRVVIVVDASNLTFGAHNDVWKGDREHMRNTVVGERYQELVTEAIKESQALKDLQHKVAREELSQATKSQRNELFQKLVDSDRNLAALLTDRDPVIYIPTAGAGAGGGNGGGADGDEADYVGKRSPTFLKFGGKDPDKIIDLPINRIRSVIATTDAENGYLQRPDSRGEVLIDDRIRERFGTRVHLHNGKLTIYFHPVAATLKGGEKFKFKIGLQDDSMPSPVETELTVVVWGYDKDEKDKKPKVKEKNDSGKISSGDGQGGSAATHGLPKSLLLTKDGRKIGDQETEKWPNDFDEHEGGVIQDLGNNEVVYKINYDNAYHLKYRSQQRGDVARDVVTEKYILGMRILMLGFERAYRVMKESKNGNDAGIGEFVDEFRKMAARGAASTVLALAENLPKIVDRASVSASENAE
jgi:hypothetical protein